LGFAFTGLLASPVLLRPDTEPTSGTDYDRRSVSLEEYGFFLEEMDNEELGIEFRHQSPVLDEKVHHILPQIASMGASVSICDFDNDGWNDMYFTNSRLGSRNKLYRNNRDGTFVDMALEMGVADMNKNGTGVSMGAVWGDYDNDGFEDLFIYKWGKPVLLKNISGKEFIAVENAGLPEWINANTALWLDFDNDGQLDLFIGGYYDQNINLWDLTTTRIMPESYEYANNGGRNHLLKNQGAGSFRDITFEYGLTSTKWTLGAGAADVNGDGFPELVIANDYSVDEFYMNSKGSGFQELGNDVGLGFIPKSGMNISFGDIDNSGQLGIYISNITEMGVLLQGNNFWKPEVTDKLHYKNVARPKGIEIGGWSYGAQFGDLNNDGFQDIYVANGFISGKVGTSYWYDYSKVSGGNKEIISDANNWPPMEGKSQSGYQQNMIWLNGPNGVFEDVSGKASEKNNRDGRSIVLVDLWNRGVLDVIVANQNNEPFIYRNHFESKDDSHWIDFELEGKASNRSAIGTKVELYWDGRKQLQILTGGIGFCSQNQHRIHFGIGKSTEVERVRIYWPSGSIQEFEYPSIDRVHEIVENDQNL